MLNCIKAGEPNQDLFSIYFLAAAAAAAAKAKKINKTKPLK